jgi:hypothetical protein
MQPSPTANPLPPVSKSSAETSENEAAVEEVPSGSCAVLYHDTQSALYHDTQSTPANDGDLFDEHDKITRFLFQVMGASFTPPPPSRLNSVPLPAALRDHHLRVPGPALLQRLWQHGALIIRQRAARH